MNAIKRIVGKFIFAIGMCVFAGSAMAFDLGGMLDKIDNSLKGNSDQDARLKELQEGPMRRQEEHYKSERERARAAQINDSMNILPAGAPKNADEYCQKITTNPSFIQLAKEMNEVGIDGLSLKHTYLDNENGDLEKWVANNFSKLSPKGKNDHVLSLTPGYGAYKGTILTAMSWVNECAVKSYKAKTPFFFIATNFEKGNVDDELQKAISAIEKGSSEYKAVGFKDNQSNIDEFERGVASGRVVYERPSSPRQATLLAFLFPGAEDIIKSTSPDPGASFRLAVKKRKESIAKADNEKDQKLYGGLRAVYNFRANPALSASYNNCVASEKDYQSKITADIESNSNKVDTVAEQKQINENINFRKKNIDYIAHGMCIYRLNVGIDMLLQVPGVTPNTIERMAISSSFNGKELSDLNSKFTPVALAKISDLLNLNAEKFHKVKVPGIYKESIKELDNARPTTRAEQQQIESEKKGLSIMSTQIENATYFHIEGEIITPLIQGKIQGK